MAHSLLLLLKGPMQSWGDDSRFKIRATATTPTKSGIVGLMAAAQGRRRTDEIEDLAALSMAVRVDQSGSLLRDYQTAQEWQTKPGSSAQLVTRYFLSDAAFLAAVESDDRAQLENIAEALRSPAFPLFMGRRSCPVHPGLVVDVTDNGGEQSLREHQIWYATAQQKRRSPQQVSLALYRDAMTDEAGGVPRQDVPLSFDPQHRRYGWRDVVRCEDVVLHNPEGKEQTSSRDIYFETVVQA